MLQLKKNIVKLKRFQTSLDRDLTQGINLDRNERVDLFDKKTQNNLKKNFSKNVFNSTPDITPLYKDLAKYHSINRRNIYIAQGITECISHILFSLVNKDEEVIILNQTYPMYEVLCKLNNVKYKTWNFKSNFKLDFNELRKKITKKTKILFLVNPNLPIEYEFDKNQKKKIYSICKRKNIILVYDEAYYYFGCSTEIKKATNLKNLVIMRTFSKAWGLPGIRLGYMITNEKLCSYVSKCRSLVETNAFSYEIARWILKNKKILNENVKDIKKGYLYLSKKFKIYNENFHGGKLTNAILLKLPSKKLCVQLKLFLKKKKIYIRDGFKYPIQNYVRISLCSPKKLRIFFNQYIKWKKTLKI